MKPFVCPKCEGVAEQMKGCAPCKETGVVWSEAAPQEVHVHHHHYDATPWYLKTYGNSEGWKPAPGQPYIWYTGGNIQQSPGINVPYNGEPVIINTPFTVTNQN